jgi:serine/threonine protein kinase
MSVTPPRREDALDPGYLQPGTQVGFYTVETRLGAGGFGAVYRVRRGGALYALKISMSRLGDVSSDDRRHMEDRLSREVAALSALRHDNIVRVHGFERWPDMDGFQYIVMDYVEGAPLLKWRRAQKPSVSQLLRVFCKISLALHEMHRLEVYHRDLKSANVLVRNDGEPVIVDFGLARPRSAYTVTRADWLLGTLSHFAPEYVEYIDSDAYRSGKGRFIWRPTTDLYALGVVLYEALTGRQPYYGEDEGSLLDNIKKVTPQLPSLVNPALPGAVDELVMKLLEKNPAKRHQSGEELAKDIELILSRAGTRDGAWSAPLALFGKGGPEAQTVGAPKSAPKSAPNAQAQPPGKRASLASIDVPLGSIAAEPAKPQPPAKPPPTPQVQSQAQPAFSFGNRAGEVVPAQEGFVSPDGEAPVAQPPPSPSDSKMRAGGPPLSTQVREAVRRVEAAGRGKQGSSRWLLPGLLGGFALIALALLVANQAVQKSAAPKAQDLLARVSAQEKGERGEVPVVRAAVDREPDPVPTHVPPMPPAALSEPAPSLPAGTTNRKRLTTDGAKRLNEDARAINDELAKANYARPKIPGPGASPGSLPGAAPGSGPARPAEPSPFAEVHRLDAKPAETGPRKFGIPLGTHIKVRLVSNLDSRTLSDAPVEAKLMRSFYLGDQMKLPARTMVYGEGSARVDSAGGRFTIRFTRLVLPDRTEVPLTAVAIDGEDRKPGLRAGRTIIIEQPKGDGTATKVGKATAGVLLGQLPGDASGQVAQRAGQVVLDGNGNATSSGQSAALLDSGADFDLFVKEAF